MEEVNKELREYIEKNIFSQYEVNNVGGHGRNYQKIQTYNMKGV